MNEITYADLVTFFWWTFAGFAVLGLGFIYLLIRKPRS